MIMNTVHTMMTFVYFHSIIISYLFFAYQLFSSHAASGGEFQVKDPYVFEFLNISEKYQYREKKSDEFHYNSEIFKIQDNTDIFGFFQNYQ